MTCKQKSSIFLPKKIVFSSLCFSFLLLWARREKNLLSVFTLGFASGKKIPREEQLLIPKAGQPLQVRIPVLAVHPRLTLLHCTGIKLYPQKGRWHSRESISHQDHIPQHFSSSSTLVEQLCPALCPYRSTLCQLNLPWLPRVPSLLLWAKQRIMLYCKKWVTRKIGKKNNKFTPPQHSTISFHLFFFF